MPELAEVEFFRKRWSAGHRAKVLAVHVHAGKKVFRGCDPREISRRLTGTRLLGSQTAAKQMLFRFSGHHWLGVHLGMTGELRVEPPGYVATKHDHLIFVQQQRQLVFNDPRMFGGILFHHGKTAPAWWTKIAPAILSPEFTIKAVQDFLRRRARTPIKAVLLLQERFPGIGNWMADEVLWRAAIHPQRPAGALTTAEVRTLHHVCRQVCRGALRTIAGQGAYLPPDLNAHIPRTWLFWHRWADGGRCPRTKQPLCRAEIGGRTTCWSPARQKLR
jgi:formamidopyrimidine-DNA glycosylase